MNATSYESMIGRAMIGDEGEKQTQLRRIECKMWASQKMTCDCGAIHDQAKIQLLVNSDGQTCAACCPACREKSQAKTEEHDARFPGVYAGWTWQNWNGSDPVIPEKPLIDEPLSQAAIDSGRLVIAHVGDSPAPEPEPKKKTPTVRALSIRQILGNKYRGGLNRELYEKTGLLTDGRILLNTRLEQPVSDSPVPLEKPARQILAEKSRKTVTPGATSFANVDGEDEPFQCTGFNDKSGAEVCRVKSAYLKTAEKLTKVKAWRFVEHDVTHRIIGQDKDGRNVAAIACVDYPE